LYDNVQQVGVAAFLPLNVQGAILVDAAVVVAALPGRLQL